MATYTATVAPDSTSLGVFLAWVTPINAAFGTFTWVQANDTGQAVLVASVMTANITAVALVSGTTYRYTYTAISSGPALRQGMSLTITGMIDAGNNTAGAAGGVTVISSLAGGAGTFDIVNANGVVKAGNTGTGTTTVSSLPALGNFIYEIWATSDSVGFPITVKIEYGPGNSNPKAAVALTMGTGSNGSGTIVNPSTRVVSGAQAGSTTAFACHFSGDGGRMCMNLFHGQGEVPAQQFSLERSYDNSGTPTGSYYTLCFTTTVAGGVGNQQTIFPTGAQTVLEIVGLAALVTKSAATGNVGSTTLVSPVFPLVGGLGNPMTNIMAYRHPDFSSNQVVYVTIYGVQHTYITVTLNLVGTTMCNIAASLMMRYD